MRNPADFALDVDIATTERHHIMSTDTTTADPFAGSESRPSVSFKDKPVGTSFTLKVIEAPKITQARDYESGQPAFWPDGNPKQTIVTGVVDTTTGEELSLWAAKPSAMFRAIGDAQKAAGAQITPGGTLTVTFSSEKPNEKNPRLNPQKLYTVTYTPGDAFATTPATPAPAQQPVQQPAPAAQQQAPAPAAQPGLPAGWTPEMVAAANAAGVPIPQA